jgi:hypothetical protein
MSSTNKEESNEEQEKLENYYFSSPDEIPEGAVEFFVKYLENIPEGKKKDKEFLRVSKAAIEHEKFKLAYHIQQESFPDRAVALTAAIKLCRYDIIEYIMDKDILSCIRDWLINMAYKNKDLLTIKFLVGKKALYITKERYEIVSSVMTKFANEKKSDEYRKYLYEEQKQKIEKTGKDVMLYRDYARGGYQSIIDSSYYINIINFLLDYDFRGVQQVNSKDMKTCFHYFKHHFEKFYLSMCDDFSFIVGCLNISNYNPEGSICDMIDEYIEAGVNKNILDAEGNNLLIKALQNDYIFVTKHLLKIGIDVSAQNYKALRLAAAKNNLELVKLIVEKDINSIKANNYDVLYDVVPNNYFAIVDYLVEKDPGCQKVVDTLSLRWDAFDD